MADETPNPTPDPTPENQAESHAPDGWELACTGILRSEFGRSRSRALDKAMMQLSAEQAWVEDRAESARVSWWSQLQGVFARMSILPLGIGLAVIMILGVVSWVFFPGVY